MKRKLKSALSLLLCMIMVFGAVVGGGEGIWELKASAASVTCHYYGSRWRVTIPANTFVQCYSSTALTTKNGQISGKSAAYDINCYNAYYMSDGCTIYSFVDQNGKTCYFPRKSSYTEYILPSSNSSISDSEYSLKNGCNHYKRFSWNSTGASEYTVKMVDSSGYPKIIDSSTSTSYDVLHASHGRGNIYEVGINGRGDPLYYTFYVFPNNSSEVKTYTFSFSVVAIAANSHYAEYDANGGSGAPASQYLECERYFNISSTTPTRPGYTFLGWSTSPNASSASYQPGDSVYCDAQSYKFYAVWRNDTSYYSVYYNANGGNGAPSRQTKASTHNLTLSTVTPTKSFSITYNANGGYTASSGKTVSCSFKSWNTAVNGNGTTYYPGGTYSNNADVTLYAQWRKPTAGALPTPTRDGYTFDGWYTGKDSGSKITESSTVSSSLTLYAHWNKITYNLSYNANGGIGTPATQSGSTSYTISSTIPTRSGYTFLGWSKSSSATTPEFRAGNTITLTGNTTLYAVWVEYCLTKSDIFSFTNSSYYFRTGTYTITDSDFNKLANYVRKIYNSNNASICINNIQALRAQKWGGSCYGMAVASILNKTGQIAFPKNFDSKASTLYDVAAPYQNSAVQSAVNYYFLSQKIPALRSNTYYNNRDNWSAGLKKLVNSVKAGKLTLFSYWWKNYGHAIAIVGYEVASDGGHNLIAYDNRYGEKYITVYVDKNYSSCVVNGDEKAYGIEFLTDFSDFDKIDIDGPNNDMVLNTRSYNQSANTEISVELNGEVTVENKAGQTLTIKDGNIGGDMDVISTHMIVKSTPDGSPAPVTLVFEVNDSTAFTFESNADEINASVTTDKCYASVTTTADTVIISENEGIYALGDNVTFNGSLSLNNEACDIISFEGQGKGDVNLVYNDDGILAEGTKGKSSITVFSNTTDVSTADFNSNYADVKIVGDGSGIAGNICVTASSENNGIYDVTLASLGRKRTEFANKSVTMYYREKRAVEYTGSGQHLIESLNPDIISFDTTTHEMIALKTGVATITVTSLETGETDTCTVTVKYAWWQILIRILLLGFLWY